MYEIQSRIDFPDAETYFPAILDALAAHQLPVQRQTARSAQAGPGGEVVLEIRNGRLDVTIRTDDEAALNWMRYAVTALIDFNARAAAPRVEWQGDAPGETLPPQLQILTVERFEQVTPRMKRIWFTGADVVRYDTLEQIHSRLLLGRGRGMPRAWPVMTDAGRIRWPEGEATLDTRVYTIRHVDVAGGRLAVDFFLGDHAGPATQWARRAAPGDGAGFIGPAAHGPAPADFRVFAGDETGLPGIARCLENLPSVTRGVALIEVGDATEHQPLVAPPGVEIRWLDRNGAPPGTTDLLSSALRGITWPGDRSACSFWCGAEYAAFRDMRRQVRMLGLPRECVVAFAHWRRGMSEPDIAAAGSEAIRG